MNYLLKGEIRDHQYCFELIYRYIAIGPEGFGIFNFKTYIFLLFWAPGSANDFDLDTHLYSVLSDQTITVYAALQQLSVTKRNAER